MTDTRVRADTLMTVAQVAARCQVSPRSVRMWLREGKLAGLELGGTTLRVRESDLDRFLSVPAALEHRAVS